ncbi:MAG TPA: hypothetical protein VKA86_02095 [Candidatus Krumholzibacteria bacterium]|nr:hypothetical protein [Candidatus Krumholzibacteria bacterium]
MTRAWLCVAAVALAGVARAGTLEPAEPQLGERATLRLETAPADSTEIPTGTGVVLRETVDPRTYRVVAVRVGDAAIALPATGDTLRWAVSPRLAQATPDSLRPIERVGDIGPSWWIHGLAAFAVLLLILSLWWRRRRRSLPGAAPSVPLDPPHEVALRRLDEIRDSGWITAGRFDDVYVHASQALRGYVSGRYRVPALDWTTDETIERLTGAGYERSEVADVDPLLRAADSVKFAARRPTEHQAERWIDDARAWIERTAVPVVYSTPDAIRAAERLRDGRDR